MTSDVTGTLDEAYDRLHVTGPEFDGALSNHGPMAAEAMVRHGHAANVHRWLDSYIKRLEEFPRGVGPIGEDWRHALGDLRRVADWTGYFRREVSEQPWRQVLETWWSRLLPGIAAGATHGVIRVGHAVRALLDDGDDPSHVTELAHGLAYWAARWQAVPGTHDRRPAIAGAETTERTHSLPVTTALAAVPRIASQAGLIRDRLRQLTELEGWHTALAAPAIPESADEVGSWLAGLADVTAARYLRYAYGNPVMLVHSATAPTAILRTLPALSEDLWTASASAAWGAAAALTAIYAPATPASAETLPAAPTDQDSANDVFAKAVQHGDEHVIKFADTAADVHARTGSPDVLAAAIHAAQLIPRPSG